MFNQTDFNEFEVSLPGDWLRKDNGDTWSFTTDKMEIRDERLFRQLDIRHVAGGQPESFQYALTIENDYFGLLIGDQEYIVRQITKREDGSAYMEWEDSKGKRIEFSHSAHP
jgi:hypothetical protein